MPELLGHLFIFRRARCVNTGTNEGGNVLSWDTAEWEMMGGLREETEEVCQPDKNLVLFNSPLSTFKQSTKFCDIL